ncbi:MAG: class I SAM-dependent methyltransferase [Candidatus Binatia bacterium]
MPRDQQVAGPVSFPPFASFRDPSGHVIHVGGRILRVVLAHDAGNTRAFLDSTSAAQLAFSGRLVTSRVVPRAEAEELLGPQGVSLAGGMVLEHERVMFPSYPYEWAPPMLRAAGQLTLDLARAVLPAGFGLKDATPWNVMFLGARPVFVDISSFERRDPFDARWLAHDQFVRTFALPLAASSAFGLRLQEVFLASREGLSVERVYAMSGLLRRLRPPLLTLATLPVWMARHSRRSDSSVYKPQRVRSPDAARFILMHLLNGLGRSLKRCRGAAPVRSPWRDYAGAGGTAADARDAKLQFVREVLRERGPARVLDVGCNAGYVSVEAARLGASVVAIDRDPEMVGAAWRVASDAGADVLPLVVDIANPSPATGWNGLEHYSFFDRASGAFDVVLMLAVLHHLLVTERIPLAEVVALAARLTSDVAVIEFVAPEDANFKRLLRGRDELYRGLTIDAFETACAAHFRVLRRLDLPGGTRRIYALKRVDR